MVYGPQCMFQKVSFLLVVMIFVCFYHFFIPMMTINKPVGKLNYAVSSSANTIENQKLKFSWWKKRIPNRPFRPRTRSGFAHIPPNNLKFNQLSCIRLIAHASLLKIELWILHKVFLPLFSVFGCLRSQRSVVISGGSWMEHIPGKTTSNQPKETRFRRSWRRRMFLSLFGALGFFGPTVTKIAQSDSAVCFGSPAAARNFWLEAVQGTSSNLRRGSSLNCPVSACFWDDDDAADKSAETSRIFGDRGWGAFRQLCGVGSIFVNIVFLQHLKQQKPSKI